MTTEKNQTLTYNEVLHRASSFLEKNNHSVFAAEWLMRERLNWTKTDLVRNFREEMPADQVKQFNQDVKKFNDGMPMQHIVGHEWFYTRQFKVTNDTLIPRPETEEWLDRVLKMLPEKPLNVLDIGTGTGVLAITEKKERPEDFVTATDLSKEALQVASQNAKDLQADVTFKQGDLFAPVENETFDVILSNPPYIGLDELNVMDQSVIDYEPKLALFAEDDGYHIYNRLAQSIANHLNPEAQIFLEIGYTQGKRVAETFKKALPQARVEIWQDFNGLDRVVAIYCE